MDPPYNNRIWYLYQLFEADPSLVSTHDETIQVDHVRNILDRMEQDSICLMLYQGSVDERLEFVYGLLDREFQKLPSVREDTAWNWFLYMLLGPQGTEENAISVHRQNMYNAFISFHRKDPGRRLLNTLALCHDMYLAIYTVHSLPNKSKLNNLRQTKKPQNPSLIDWAALWDGIRLMAAHLERSCSDDSDKDDDNDNDNDSDTNEAVYFFNYVQVKTVNQFCVFGHVHLLRYMAQVQNVEKFFEQLAGYMGDLFLASADTDDTATSILTNGDYIVSGTESTALNALYYHLATTVVTFIDQLQALFDIKRLHNIFQEKGRQEKQGIIQRVRLKEPTARVLSGLYTYLKDHCTDKTLSLNVLDRNQRKVYAQKNAQKRVGDDDDDDDDDDNIKAKHLQYVINWHRVVYDIHTLESTRIPNADEYGDDDGDDDDGESTSQNDLYIQPYNVSLPMSGVRDKARFNHFCRRFFHWKLAYLVHTVYFKSLSYWSSILERFVPDYNTENRSLYDRLLSSAVISHDSLMKRKRKLRGDISNQVMSWDHFHHTFAWCSLQSSKHMVSAKQQEEVGSSWPAGEGSDKDTSLSSQYQSPGIAMQSYRLHQACQMIPSQTSDGMMQVDSTLADCGRQFRDHGLQRQGFVWYPTTKRHVPILQYPRSRTSQWIWSALACLHYIRTRTFPGPFPVSMTMGCESMTATQSAIVDSLLCYVFFQSDQPVFRHGRETAVLTEDDTSSTDDTNSFIESLAYDDESETTTSDDDESKANTENSSSAAASSSVSRASNDDDHDDDDEDDDDEEDDDDDDEDDDDEEEDFTAPQNIMEEIPNDEYIQL